MSASYPKTYGTFTINMKSGSLLKFLLLFFIITASFYLQAQEAIARPSPLAIVTGKYKDTYFKITYSQPHKKGREVFGKLVPFDKVWRTGANEATEITVTKNIQINGTLLKAGTYSIFTIPQKDTWTIIINAELGLWGSYNYNQSLDVMRFNVPVAENPANTSYEAFTIQLSQRNDVADLLMFWDKTNISIPVKFLN